MILIIGDFSVWCPREWITNRGFFELVPQVDLNRSYEVTFPAVGPVNAYVFEVCATLMNPLMNPYLEWLFQDIMWEFLNGEAVGIIDFTAEDSAGGGWFQG